MMWLRVVSVPATTILCTPSVRGMVSVRRKPDGKGHLIERLQLQTLPMKSMDA